MVPTPPCREPTRLLDYPIRRGVSPWIWIMVRLASQPLVTSESRRARATVSYYWGLGSPRAGADMGPRLGGGARSGGHIKHAPLRVMADHGVRLLSREAHMCSFTPANCHPLLANGCMFVCVI